MLQWEDTTSSYNMWKEEDAFKVMTVRKHKPVFFTTRSREAVYNSSFLFSEDALCGLPLTLVPILIDLLTFLASSRVVNSLWRSLSTVSI